MRIGTVNNNCNRETVNATRELPGSHKLPPSNHDRLQKSLLAPAIGATRIGRFTSRVKVTLHVYHPEGNIGSTGVLQIDPRRKHVSLLSPEGYQTDAVDANTEDRTQKKQAPRLFAFDAIFPEESTEFEISDGLSTDLIKSVADGQDGCMVSIGSAFRAKEIAIFGSKVLKKTGILPLCAIRLFEEINNKKAQGSRFSVRVSAVQLSAKSGRETVTDLLFPYSKDGDQAPDYFLSGNRGLSEITRNPDSILENLAQVRIADAEAACMFLNVMKIAADRDPGSHFIFTFHLYQCRVDCQSRKVTGGRSRLHFIKHGERSPSITSFGGMLSAILNDQKHLPSRWTNLGTVLRECLGSFQCHSVIMVHVSGEQEFYAETLASLQLGSRIHRLRKHRGLKHLNMKLRSRSLGDPETSKPHSNGTKRTPSDPSSSEQSCDTVIYLGPSAEEATDGEHPPHYVTALPCAPTGKPPRGARVATANIVTNGADSELFRKKLEGHQNGEPKTMAMDMDKQLWIDGPLNTRKFNADLTRPHRSIDQPHLVGLQSFHSTLMTKAQLVRHWITDQNQRNDPNSLQNALSEYQTALPNLRGTSCSQNVVQNQQVHDSLVQLRCQHSKFDTKTFANRLEFYLENQLHCKEVENSGFHYEIVEVTEPLVPVPTRDIAVQVSPEDIWQSYSEMHMKSNYHCRYDKVLYLKSSPASDAIQKYLKLGGLSASVPSVSMDTENWLLDAPWNHPLRVLSQECLTVVSTFADSASVKSETTLRLSPPLEVTGYR